MGDPFEAALKIQATWKGWKVRRGLLKVKTMSDMELLEETEFESIQSYLAAIEQDHCIAAQQEKLRQDSLLFQAELDLDASGDLGESIVGSETGLDSDSHSSLIDMYNNSPEPEQFRDSRHILDHVADDGLFSDGSTLTPGDFQASEPCEQDEEFSISAYAHSATHESIPCLKELTLLDDQAAKVPPETSPALTEPDCVLDQDAASQERRRFLLQRKREIMLQVEALQSSLLATN